MRAIDAIIPAMERRVAPRIFGITLAIMLAGCSTLQRVPADGLYAGELCTAVVAGPLNCGAAEVFFPKIAPRYA